MLYKKIMNNMELKENLEYRKESIKRMLSQAKEESAVIIKKGFFRKKVLSENVYKIMCLNGLIKPIASLKTYGDDQYKNGTWIEIKELEVPTPKRKTRLSFIDKMKISKKIKKIEKIKTGKKSIYNKKKVFTIKLYPISHAEFGKVLDKKPKTQTKRFKPDEVGNVKIEITPKELAIAGIDYKELIKNK